MKLFKTKTRPPLLVALAVASIVGFIAIIFNELGVYDLTPFTGHILFTVLGIGLIFEGGITKFWNSVVRGTLNFDQISMKLITIVVGVIAIIVGLAGLFSFNAAILSSSRLLIAIIATITIVIETWVIK